MEPLDHLTTPLYQVAPLGALGTDEKALVLFSGASATSCGLLTMSCFEVVRDDADASVAWLSTCFFGGSALLSEVFKPRAVGLSTLLLELIRLSLVLLLLAVMTTFDSGIACISACLAWICSSFLDVSSFPEGP